MSSKVFVIANVSDASKKFSVDSQFIQPCLFISLKVETQAKAVLIRGLIAYITFVTVQA